MLHIQVSTPSPDPVRPSLADLSRNSSVISSSSSGGSTSSLILNTPRPRPVRTFSSPRSRSRDAPPTPRSSRPPVYLSKELGLANNDRQPSDNDLAQRAQSRSKSRPPKSRNSSVGQKLSIEDFDMGDILGEGSYSTVHQALHIASEREFAIKIIEKVHLRRNNKLQTAMAEKNALVKLGAGHPGIVRLHWAFQDDACLYFVLDLARNGELQTRISRLGSLSIDCARYYAAQLVDAVAYMHSKNVIHRDLKPENLLLDDGMRLKITDFGTGKILDSNDDRAGTFVGTAQYVSPELLSNNQTFKSSDLWAVGCIIFQMIAGRFPFHALSEYLTWQKIKSLEYAFPEGFDDDARDLVQKLLVLDPTQRLGAGELGSPNDMAALKSHPFFNGINWSTLWSDLAPPMEAGLVKKEHPLSGETRWQDIGEAWDNLVGDDSQDDSWASDDGDFGKPDLPPGSSAYSRHYQQYDGPREIGPLDVVDAPSIHGQELVDRLKEAAQGEREQEIRKRISSGQNGATQPMSIPDLTRHSDSQSSSSEGSPVEKVGAAMERMELERGRDRAQTPIQLLPPVVPDTRWSSLLQPSEVPLFHSAIEVRSRSRRLTATLLPIPVPPSKSKPRYLVLTPQRLLVIKVKKGRSANIMSIAVRNELLIPSKGEGDGEKGAEGSSAKDKEKAAKSVILDVSPKGEKEFVVITSSKSYAFRATDEDLAASWLDHIQNAIGS